MSTRTGPGPLGEFLAARRSRLRPGDVGVVTHGERRRVPGLRREELAGLAGVSAPYYARLEQGASRHASPEVLDALARALDLDEPERRHLHALGGAPRTRLAEPPPERLAPALAPLLAALDGVPAVVLGPRLDVLAWNPLGRVLTAPHRDPADRPNSARSVFTDPRTAALYPDRERKRRAVVGHLRLTAGRRPDDARLAALVAELTAASPEFARLWSDHTVAACAGGAYVLAHPDVGPLTVTQQTLAPVGAEDQSLVTFTVEPGSASADALDRLRAASVPGGPRPSGSG